MKKTFEEHTPEQQALILSFADSIAKEAEKQDLKYLKERIVRAAVLGALVDEASHGGAAYGIAQVLLDLTMDMLSHLYREKKIDRAGLIDYMLTVREGSASVVELRNIIASIFEQVRTQGKGH